MKSLLENIDGLKKKFAELQPLSFENSQKLDKKFRLEWNFNSNHIEGNTLTYGETELLLIFDQTKGNHELREYEEMKGHDVALKLIYDLAADKERNLSEKFIRELNEILLVRPFYKEAITPDGQPTRRLIKIGEYKSFPNSVRLANEEIFHYPSPTETPALMGDLINWYHEVSNDVNIHPIEVAAQLHYKFVCIHPFDDGNGRISRLLMNYHLIKKYYPPVIIKSADKKNYLFALREADTGNLEAFNTYIAEQLLWSYEISIKAGKSESIDEAGDWEKKVELLKRELTKKPEAVIERNFDSIYQIFHNSFDPLITKILLKIKPLEDFYQKNYTNLFLQLKGGNTAAISKDTDLRSTIKDFNELINYIEFTHSLENFKKNGINVFSSFYNVKIRFNELTYDIIINNDESNRVTKINSDYLTDFDVKNICDKITNSLFDQITLNTKN